MKKLACTVIFFLQIFSPHQAVAGPWTVVEGEVLVSLSQFMSEFDQFYNTDKEKFDLPDNVVNYDSILDVTYGFTEDWEASIRFKGFKSSRNFTGDEDSQAGFGDGWLKLKHHFFHGFVDAAAQVGIKWPGSYDAKEINSPGDGQTDFEMRLLFGKFWDRFYVDFEGAYRFRSGDPSDEYELYLDTGYAISSYLIVRFFCQMRDAMDGVGSAGLPTTILPKTEEDAVTVGGGVTIKPKKDVAVTLQVASTLSGRNTPKQSNIGITISYSFDYFWD